MHNQEFLILPAEEVCRLLASDDLNVPDEETIFQALVMWAKHDLSNRKKYLAKLLSHIKLPLMSPQVLLGSTYWINLIRLFCGVKTQSHLSVWFPEVYVIYRVLIKSIFLCFWINGILQPNELRNVNLQR